MPEGVPELELPPDGRTDDERQLDRETADQQASRVRARWNDRGLWNQRVERVRTDRQTRLPDGYEQVEERLRGDDDPVLLVAHEVLVRTDGLTPEERGALLAAGGSEIPNLRGRVVRVPVQDSTGTPDGLPSDTKEHYFAPMGPVMKMQCGPEPAIGRGPRESVAPAGVRVAVIDTGIAAAGRNDGWLAHIHENVRNRDPLDVFGLPGLDFGAGHGTFAAGIIRQLAPDANVKIYRALDTDGLGSEAAVASAMVEAAMDGAQIINLSLGMETIDEQPPVALEVAVDIIRTERPDALLVAAAGNYGHSVPCWPAAFDDVIAVAALDRQMEPAEWSSRGSWVQCSTTGEAVLSTFVEGDEEEPDQPGEPIDQYGPLAWAVWSGTSFAAPQICGAVAQLMGTLGVGPRDALDVLLQGASTIPEFGSAVQILPPT